MSDETDRLDSKYDESLDVEDNLRGETAQIEDFEAFFTEEKAVAAAAKERDVPTEGDEAPISSVDFALEPANEPYELGTRIFAKERNTDERFFVGSVLKYKTRRGLGVGQQSVNLINQVRYNRLLEEQRIGLWAHFMAPTVAAESFGGLHLLVNSYDRAAFTFGYYQLAAHIPNENLILLFRALMKLPTAKVYFQDLSLSSAGRLQVKTSDGFKNLEREQVVALSSGRQETQIPDFMTYLNPKGGSVEKGEALVAAKLMHWVLHDPAAMDAAVRVPFEIMRKKALKFTPTYGLAGKEPELAIWISDLLHHGRGGGGTKQKILAALREPTFQRKVDALSKIDTYTNEAPNGEFATRRRTISRMIAEMQRESRFDGVPFGEGKLSLEAEV